MTSSIRIAVPLRTRAHRPTRTGLWTYVIRGDIATIVTAPVVYSVVIAFAVLDLWVTLYQAVCFRAWGIRRVRRRRYLVINRHKLGYLNGIEKLNCLYCSYTNGVIAYTREVAARTEQYWCPIRYRTRLRDPHKRYTAFVPYGDAAAYHSQLPLLRERLKK